MTKSHRSHASVQPRRHHHKHRPNQTTILAWLSCLCLAVTLVGCGGGGGGSDDDGGSPDTPASQAGLTFSYPVDGQQDVFVKSQIVLSFDAGAGGFDSLANNLTLVANGTPVDTVVTQDANQRNIFRLHVKATGDSVERPGLRPSTDYAVRAAGGTLVTFSTHALDGHPSPGGNFGVEHYTSIGNVPVPFTVFNPIRAHFSQPVEAGTVNLCRSGETLGTDCTVQVSGPSGNVPGTLMILGSDMTFDPDDGTDTNGTLDPANYTGDLEAGKTYTVAFDGVKSVFGDTLNTAFNVTPVSIGQDVVKALLVEPTMNKTVDSPLDGQARNIAHIVSQLIGVNNQDAYNAPRREGLISRLSEPSDDPRYQGTFPALISAGQKFTLDPISLKLNGDVQTPVITGDIQTWFVNDASVYIVGNSLFGLKTPTMVLMRLDLGISTKVSNNDAIESMSNGVFNQTALNVVAAGTAVPQPNGDVKLVTMGSFPVAVNRTADAIVDFELEVTLPNPKAGSTPSIGSDQAPPRIIAQYPSACFYTFGTDGFVNHDAVSGAPGTTTLTALEAGCIDVMRQRDVRQTADGANFAFPEPYANSLPLHASPYIVFSEPVDPASLEGNIKLLPVGGSGMAIDANLRVDGTSVIIDPVEPLAADTQYTLTVGNGVSDLAGNGLVGNFPGSTVVSNITFNTQPMVVPTDASGNTIQIDPTQREPVRQTAPFLTVLTPGMPCPLLPSTSEPKANFRTGGDIVGRCVGDTPREQPDGTVPPSPAVVYPVLSLPANKTVQAFFSKPVKTETIELANGCLVKGGGNSNPDATVAIQIMQGGQCKGVVDGDLAMLSSAGAALTRGFTFRPAQPFEAGQRYWIVVCGSSNPLNINYSATSQCATGRTIHGQSGLPLNTDPLRGTGSQVLTTVTVGRTGDCPYGTPANPNASAMQCYSDYRGGGGPDIVMPFDGAPATRAFYAVTRALPITDTNGNGVFDNTPYTTAKKPYPDLWIGGLNTGENLGAQAQQFNAQFGRERVQMANSVAARPVKGFSSSYPPELAYLSGGRPVVIGQLEAGESCAPARDVRFDDGTSVIGAAAPDHCLPVDLLPGGLLTVSAFNGFGVVSTGRLLLRFHGVDDADKDNVADHPQVGYIVPRCQGTFQGEPYNYAPCFVAKLSLTVNAPDTFGAEDDSGSLEILQQDITVQAFGPVAFEQNGRMLISTVNANKYDINASLGPYFPLPAPTLPGEQSLQLVGPALHGGVAFPMR